MISILLPVFNAAPFLGECLDSTLAQTYTDWELIAINDFSTDESPAILQSYANQDHRIQVLQNEEKGIIPALKLALQSSSGSYITRMDADDKMATHKLEALQCLLKQCGEGYVATGLVNYFSEQPLGNGYKKYEKWLNQLTTKASNFSEIYKECVIPSPCWMLSKNDLRRIGGFDLDIYPEDYDLCFRMYEMSLKVATEKSVLHYWRDHSNRASRNDPHYSDNSFLDLKLSYFLKLDYNKKQTLVLWGAGKKGKQIAKYLVKQSINFQWVCDTPTKWGHQIHGVVLENYEPISDINRPQVIVAVASPDGQAAINAFLQKATNHAQSFFFC